MDSYIVRQPFVENVDSLHFNSPRLQNKQSYEPEEDTQQPFRPINIDQIQNSCGGSSGGIGRGLFPAGSGIKMSFKSPMSSKRSGFQKSNKYSSNKKFNHLGMLPYVNGKAFGFENSKGKSELTDQSNLSLHSGSGGRVNGFHFNSDFKRQKASGPPISASKFADENGSPQSASHFLKKPGQAHCQKLNTPLKQTYFSPEDSFSGKKLYKEKTVKGNNFNDDVKLRCEPIRVNGLAMDCIMEDQSIDDHLKLSSRSRVEEHKLDIIENQSSSGSFSVPQIEPTASKNDRVVQIQDMGEMTWEEDHFQSNTKDGIGMIGTENSVLVDYDMSLNDNQAMQDEETRMDFSLLAKRKTESYFTPNISNLYNYDHMQEFGQSSLLVDSTSKPVGLFAQGDRFVPVRPDDALLQGEQKFMHEENLIFNKKIRQERREDRRQRRRERNEDTDEDDNSSRNSSVSSSNLSDNQHSDDDQYERSQKDQFTRRQRILYNNLLQERCFGKSEYDDDQQLCLSNPIDNKNILNQQGASSQATTGGNRKNGKRDKKKVIGKNKSSILKYKKKLCKQSSLNSEENDMVGFMRIGGIARMIRGHQDQLTLQTKVKNTQSVRNISKQPFKVLDAPQLQDDFYLNLVDWSCTNVLAVGLNDSVYIWSAFTSQVKMLCEVPEDDAITSVQWSQQGTHLAVGTFSGQTQIWDTVQCKLIRTFKGHLARVSSVSWNKSVLSTGSRDRTILQRDIRARDDKFSKMTGHKQEVCGLKWSFDGQQLASGGNDNKLMIWNLRSDKPIVKFHEHTAAVKAIGWSPHQNGLLATGGGTADRHIRFWNTHTLQPLHAIDTGSQVCNLIFSKTTHEIVSTHGYSLNQIILWKYPSMQKVQTLTGHTQRVLYLSISPCGENIVTGAGDETLRFWNMFPSMSRGMLNRNPSIIVPSNLDLR